MDEHWALPVSGNGTCPRCRSQAPKLIMPSGWVGVESSAELGATRQPGWRVALMLTAPFLALPRKPQPEPKREKEAKKPTIKKPLNAFMLYMKEMRAKVIAECTLKESAAINQILGRRVRARGARCHRPSAASPSLTAALEHVTSIRFQTGCSYPSIAPSRMCPGAGRLRWGRAGRAEGRGDSGARSHCRASPCSGTRCPGRSRPSTTNWLARNGSSTCSSTPAGLPETTT